MDIVLSSGGSGGRNETGPRRRVERSLASRFEGGQRIVEPRGANDLPGREVDSARADPVSFTGLPDQQ